jgi:hypothetical protein
MKDMKDVVNDRRVGAGGALRRGISGIVEVLAAKAIGTVIQEASSPGRRPGLQARTARQRPGVNKKEEAALRDGTVREHLTGTKSPS